MIQPLQPQRIEEIKYAVQTLSGYLIWMAFFWVMFAVSKQVLVELAGGVVWRFKGGYDNDEIVIVEGEWARIQRIGWLKTDFNVFTWTRGMRMPSGGNIRSILNNELRRIDIRKPLEKISENDLNTLMQKIEFTSTIPKRR
jgi:hypothetical protein